MKLSLSSSSRFIFDASFFLFFLLNIGWEICWTNTWEHGGLRPPSTARLLLDRPKPGPAGETMGLRQAVGWSGSSLTIITSSSNQKFRFPWQNTRSISTKFRYSSVLNFWLLKRLTLTVLGIAHWNYSRLIVSLLGSLKATYNASWHIPQSKSQSYSVLLIPL